MRFQVATLFFASLVATAFARRSCGAPEPSNELRTAAVQFSKEASEGRFQAQAAFVVDTYFHVVSSGTTEAQGNVPDAKLKQQVRKSHGEPNSSSIFIFYPI